MKTPKKPLGNIDIWSLTAKKPILLRKFLSEAFLNRLFGTTKETLGANSFCFLVNLRVKLEEPK